MDNNQEAQKNILIGTQEGSHAARSRSGTKTHIGYKDGMQAMCGAKVMPYMTRHTEITCTKCAEAYGFNSTKENN
jgi:hypothetical protein